VKEIKIFFLEVEVKMKLLARSLPAFLHYRNADNLHFLSFTFPATTARKEGIFFSFSSAPFVGVKESNFLASCACTNRDTLRLLEMKGRIMAKNHPY
jgi:hypothetical protein